MMNLLINILCVVQLVTVIIASADTENSNVESIQAICKQKVCCYTRNFPKNRIIEMSYKVKYSGNYYIDLNIFREDAGAVEVENKRVYYDENIEDNNPKHGTLKVINYQEVLICFSKMNNKRKEAVNKVTIEFNAVSKSLIFENKGKETKTSEESTINEIWGSISEWIGELTD